MFDLKEDLIAYKALLISIAEGNPSIIKSINETCNYQDKNVKRVIVHCNIKTCIMNTKEIVHFAISNKEYNLQIIKHIITLEGQEIVNIKEKIVLLNY